MPAMEFIIWLTDFVLHVDRHIGLFVSDHGAWVYALLFAIVFVETGLVVMPFLPGDSLLFITGTLCGSGLISLPLCLAVLGVAAVAGDQLNCAVGRRVGDAVWQWQGRWFNRHAFEQAHGFYQRHGGITIVVARFMPFIRTFAPFVAGVARMDRRSFTLFNLLGAFLWVFGLCLSGYIFGNLPWVQTHLSHIIWGLILIPSAIAIFTGLRKKQSKQLGSDPN
jgi:membrane-associated protein